MPHRRSTSWPTPGVRAIEAHGLRDKELHRLALMLHEAHPLHTTPDGEKQLTP